MARRLRSPAAVRNRPHFGVQRTDHRLPACNGAIHARTVRPSMAAANHHAIADQRTSPSFRKR
jgi:hypothetical protein